VRKTSQENLCAQHGARTLRGPFRRINLWQQPCGEQPQVHNRCKLRDSKSIESTSTKVEPSSTKPFGVLPLISPGCLKPTNRISGGCPMRWRRESALDFYTATFGLFLLVSPWLFAYANENARLDLWASGAAIAAISIAALVAFSNWEEWLNLLLGLWLIASPWLLGFVYTRAMHVSIGLGAMVAFLAALELWLVNYEPQYDSR
jgi:hypothetical protein